VLYRSLANIPMITIFKVVFGFLLLCAIPGTIMGVISSYRAGQKPHKELYLILKKFAQHENWPVLWHHVKQYWPYYGMAFIFIAMGFSE